MDDRLKEAVLRYYLPQGKNVGCSGGATKPGRLLTLLPPLAGFAERDTGIHQEP